MEFRRRMGIFLITIGIFLMMLYLLSGMTETPMCGLLGWGAGAAILGSLMVWLNPKPEPKESGRFRMLKRRDRNREKQDEKKAGK